jgi:UDP:flavonoid glycosyltransferase YjiC (YdhE family)
MRVLITTLPGYGHLHPMVPLARALEARGHEVRVATSPSFTSAVAGSGLTPIAVGPGWTLADEARQFPELAAMPYGEEQFRYVHRRIFRGALADLLLPDLLAFLQDWRPDAIVRDDQDFAACVAGELLGIPHAVGGLIWPYNLRLRAELLEAETELGVRSGLPAGQASMMAYRYLALPAMPHSWIADGEYLPPSARLLRPEPFNESGDEHLPDWIDTLPDRPIVHASLGTIFNRVPGIHAAILRGCADLPVNLILAVGREMDPARFGPQPDNVRIVHYIPQRLLLPRCDAVITHGGYGTVMGCLSEGLPMVVIPIAADQPRNARRCIELGVGRVVLEDERRPDTIRDALLDVLAMPRYRERARTVQAEMQALPGAEHGVHLLERLARDREPIPRSQS